MEKQNVSMGKNKTGVQMSPQDIDKMMQDVRSQTVGRDDGAGIAAVRTSYIAEADPVGSVPMPGSVKGAVKAGAKAMTGKSPSVFIDKLGERLAFERTGVRLYEAMLTKYQASPKIDGISVDQLSHFRDEEAKHFKWISDALKTLGADPTAETPGADVAGVVSMGLMRVIEDPSTSVPQSLHAILVAELADYDSWELLIKLADDIGQSDMAKQFRQALQEEQEHLSTVRGWVEQGARSALQE